MLRLKLVGSTGYNPALIKPELGRKSASVTCHRVECVLQYHLLVGTYHKTGSVWMHKVFSEFALKTQLPFRFISPHAPFYKVHLSSQAGVDQYLNQLVTRATRHVIFDDHSRFGTLMPEHCQYFRGLRVVRHPVSIICSAAHYHQTATEAWLHKPNKAFGGKSYQQQLNSLGDVNSQYRFEMQHCSNWTLTDMARFDQDDYFLTVKFEELMQDDTFQLVRRLAAHAGLDERERQVLEAAFYKHSLFGKLRAKKVRHIRNKQGRPYGLDWDQETVDLYRALYAPITTKLGYDIL